MTTVNHALWGATMGRLIGMPVEGAVFASIPDVITLPFQFYYRLQGKKRPHEMPRWVFLWYSLIHNWWIGFALILLLFFLRSNLWILGFAYFFHQFEDAFVHTNYATSFLYPLWKGKIRVYSAAEHKWIQVVDIVLMVLANVVISNYNLKII